jgi:hypothetical protein
MKKIMKMKNHIETNTHPFGKKILIHFVLIEYIEKKRTNSAGMACGKAHYGTS